MIKQKVTGLQFIADYSFIEEPMLQTPHYIPYVGGTLGIAIHRGEIPGLRDFLSKIRPESDLENSNDDIIVSTCIVLMFKVIFILLY